MEQLSERDFQHDRLSDQEKASVRKPSDNPLATLEIQGLENDKLEPIAVIGFAARLPQDATTAESFWQLLCEGRSARSEIPKDRFNIDAFYHPDPDRIDAVSLHVSFDVLGWHRGIFS